MVEFTLSIDLMTQLLLFICLPTYEDISNLNKPV